MPFVKQTVTTIRRPPSEVGNRFIGRANELHVFREHMLKPEDPAYAPLNCAWQALRLLPLSRCWLATSRLQSLDTMSKLSRERLFCARCQP